MNSIFIRLTGGPYKKNDPKIYEKLDKTRNEEKAILIAERKYREFLINNPQKGLSKMTSATTIYSLVKEINLLIAKE